MFQRLILCAFVLVIGLLARPEMTAAVHHLLANLPTALGPAGRVGLPAPGAGLPSLHLP